jgi:hypothetical protein
MRTRSKPSPSSRCNRRQPSSDAAAGRRWPHPTRARGRDSLGRGANRRGNESGTSRGLRRRPRRAGETKLPVIPSSCAPVLVGSARACRWRSRPDAPARANADARPTDGSHTLRRSVADAGFAPDPRLARRWWCSGSTSCSSRRAELAARVVISKRRAGTGVSKRRPKGTVQRRPPTARTATRVPSKHRNRPRVRPATRPFGAVMVHVDPWAVLQAISGTFVKTFEQVGPDLAAAA